MENVPRELLSRVPALPPVDRSFGDGRVRPEGNIYQGYPQVIINVSPLVKVVVVVCVSRVFTTTRAKVERGKFGSRGGEGGGEVIDCKYL